MDGSLSQEKLVSTNRIIYTASDFAKKSLLYLQEAGFLQATKVHESKRTSLDSYLFFIVLSGSGSFFYHGKSRKLNQGDCVFIDCENGYMHKTSNHLWNLQWVHFNGASMNAIYNKYLERGGENIIHTSNIGGYTKILESIYEIAGSKDYIRDIELNEKLAELLSKIMKATVKIDKSKTNKVSSLDNIKSFLDEHYTETLSLDEISEKFYINKFYLTRIFKEKYDLTIMDYILQQRVTKAKELLRFTDLTVADISEKVGFKDANYFSRIFKKIENLTPSGYRKEW